MKEMVGGSNFLSLMKRYDVSLDNAWCRALRGLKEIQEERITKRTQAIDALIS
jgi:hypothetical protein